MLHENWKAHASSSFSECFGFEENVADSFSNDIFVDAYVLINILSQYFIVDTTRLFHVASISNSGQPLVNLLQMFSNIVVFKWENTLCLNTNNFDFRIELLRIKGHSTYHTTTSNINKNLLNFWMFWE